MPGHIATPNRVALVRLKITIVGGSIAGLATAYSLQKAGHDVVILEKSDGNRRSHCGLRSPPNMTRLLNQWGLGPALNKYAHRCTQFVFQKGESGELLGSMKLHEQFLKQLMADFLFIQHGDLHTMLHEHAVCQGVQIRYKCPVKHVDPATVSVLLENGERITSDVVIGADGPNSFVRTSVLGRKLPGTKEREIALNFVIPVESMKLDEDLRGLAVNKDWTIWLGDGYTFHGCLINCDRDYSIVLGYTLSDDTLEFDEEWQDHYPLEHFNLDLEKFEPRIRKMLSLARDVAPQIYISRPALENLVCDRARVVLVGEAAHPLLPSGQQNTALSIEDAQTLGSLFSGLQDKEQVPQLLTAYEELRQTRCQAALDWERRKRRMLTLCPGPGQEERDMKFRETMVYGEWDSMNEKVFRGVWGDELDQFVYDATEKVEDWWTKWDPLLVRVNPNRRSMGPRLLVSISKNGN